MRTSQGRLSETITGYEAVPPPEVKAFPELLRAGGYSTANWAKKDYQFGEPFTLWDVDDGGFWGPIDAALWRRLPKEKPLFVMMNLVSTHESYLVVGVIILNSGRPLPASFSRNGSERPLPSPIQMQ